MGTVEVHGLLWYFFFKNNGWVKGKNITHVIGGGKAYSLDYAMWEIYERKHLEVMEVRDRLLYAIKKLYPDRTSGFATKLAQVKEPMISEQYSVVSFNDHPDTTFEDIMKVIEEAKV